jgi:hypothetical protein
MQSKVVLYGSVFAFVVFLAMSVPKSASALSIDHSTYGVGESISVTCPVQSHILYVFDVTANANENSIGEFNCGSSVVIDGQDSHMYAILELVGDSCGGNPYDACATNGTVLAEVRFTVSSAGSSGWFVWWNSFVAKS